MLKLKKFHFCTKEELLLVLKWRNSLGIREQMVNKDVISEKDHFAYVKGLDKRIDVEYYLIIKDEEYLGVIDLVNIHNYEAELGLYKNPEIKKRGVGSILMKAIFRLAKQKRLKKLTLKVLKSNNQAIGLYEKFEFVVV